MLIALNLYSLLILNLRCAQEKNPDQLEVIEKQDSTSKYHEQVPLARAILDFTFRIQYFILEYMACNRLIRGN